MKKKTMIPPTMDRTIIHTHPKKNSRIYHRTIERINAFRNASEMELSLRIKQLEREWDSERTLEIIDAFLIFGFIVIGWEYSRNWFLGAAFIAFFHLVYALFGWCPHMFLIRMLGIRTPKEIHLELMAIKYLRNDFSLKTDNPKDLYNMAIGEIRTNHRMD